MKAGDRPIDRNADVEMGFSQYPDHAGADINLFEYLDIAIKRKGMVLSIFGSAVVLAAIASFLMPRIYEVSTIIEPPINAITDSGVQNWDSVSNIKERIRAGAYDVKIIKDLGLTGQTLDFEIVQPKDTRLIRVSLREPANRADEGKKILGKLLDELIQSYSKIVADKQDRIGNQIKTIENNTANQIKTIGIQISDKENEIKLKNEQLKIYTDREQQFLEEIKEIRSSASKLNDKREAVFEKKDDVSALYYAATIQQNLTYFIQLQNDLAALKNKKEDLLNAIENLKNAISAQRVEMSNLTNAGRIEIMNLRLSQSNVQNISVVQAPEVSMRPVGPKRVRNVLFAAVIGLAMGLISAFAAEHWARHAAERFSR